MTFIEHEIIPQKSDVILKFRELDFVRCQKDGNIKNHGFIFLLDKCICKN